MLTPVEIDASTRNPLSASRFDRTVPADETPRPIIPDLPGHPRNCKVVDTSTKFAILRGTVTVVPPLRPL
jgi:hypothetical protein